MFSSFTLARLCAIGSLCALLVASTVSARPLRQPPGQTISTNQLARSEGLVDAPPITRISIP